MTRRVGDTQTLELFEIPQPPSQQPASMDYGAEVSLLVGQILKDADGDRHEIASRMTRLTGKDVSKYMLDAWSSESRDTYNMPFYLAAVLEAACSTHELSNWLADKRGGRLLLGRETLNAELGKLERVRDEAGKRIRDLKKLMGEMA